MRINHPDWLFLVFILWTTTQVRSQDIFSLQNCKGRPIFIDTLRKCEHVRKSLFFTTGLKYNQGLFYTNTADVFNKDICFYRHPSWLQGGTLGKFIIEPFGDIYVLPAPYINTFYNEYSKQNTIYRIESSTGVMNEAWRFSGGELISHNNPYGVMGIAYDCSGQSIYISTIAGSNLYETNGKVYKLDIGIDDKITLSDSLSGINALSLAVANINGTNKLIYGDADQPVVNSIDLTKEGKFTNMINKEIDLGKNFMTSHKAVNIKFISDDQIIIDGIYFDYTLAIPGTSEKNQYDYKWNKKSGEWNLIDFVTGK